MRLQIHAQRPARHLDNNSEASLTTGWQHTYMTCSAAAAACSPVVSDDLQVTFIGLVSPLHSAPNRAGLGRLIHSNFSGRYSTPGGRWRLMRMRTSLKSKYFSLLKISFDVHPSRFTHTPASYPASA